jgi:biopolymer transport protein ExbD
MTSLIDVIFLLLLFFMLTSTFSRFAEVPLPLGGSGTVTAEATTPPLFLRIGEEAISLNGQDIAVDSLAEVITPEGDSPQPVIVSVTPAASAQRLTDVLVALRSIPNIALNVLVPA